MQPAVIRALQARAQSKSPITKAEYMALDCNEAATQIRQRLPANSLDLAFIDPTNWQLEFETIRRLTEGRRMDLIITFQVGGMKRAAEYAPAKLDLFFGGADWRAAYEASPKEGHREGSRTLLNCYEAQLHGIGYEWVVDDVRITNTKHIGLYHLVFASKNPRGEDFWQKITDRSAGGQLRLFREPQAEYEA
jgi:three-Cys-motif partner protein